MCQNQQMPARALRHTQDTGGSTQRVKSESTNARKGIKRDVGWEKTPPQSFQNQQTPVRIKYPLRQCVIEQARQIAECVCSGHAGYRGMGFR